MLHEAREILKDITFIDGDIRDAVTEAARYHDIGKTHRVFQDTMKRGMNGRVDEDVVWAKSQKGNLRHSVPGFRHEAASALAYLEHTKQQDPLAEGSRGISCRITPRKGETLIKKHLPKKAGWSIPAWHKGRGQVAEIFQRRDIRR